MAEEFTPTAAEIKEEKEAGADDPALVKLDADVPEVEDEDDDDLSSEDDLIDEAELEAEDYDPANDGDDTVLQEVAVETIEEGAADG
jgi:hypothetical protein